MSETLIPFDFSIFEKEPGRVRYETGIAPLLALAIDGCVVIKWPWMKHIGTVWPNEFMILRLAAKKRKVMLRLYTPFPCASPRAVTDSEADLERELPCYLPDGEWLGPAFEHEIEAT